MFDFLQNNRGLIIAEGVLFTILGAIAVILPGVSTLSLELFLGWLVFFIGAVQLFRTLKVREAVGFYGSLLTSILYIIFGLLMVIFPVSGIITLTILLMVFFLFDGFAKIYMGFELRPVGNSMWFVLSGVISLAMAFIIFKGWPGTAFWVLGLLLGINMIFFGATLICFGMGIPKKTDVK